jgi:hypothetical protein
VIGFHEAGELAFFGGGFVAAYAAFVEKFGGVGGIHAESRRGRISHREARGKDNQVGNTREQRKQRRREPRI